MGIHVDVVELLKRLQTANQNPLCLDLEMDSTEILMRKYFLNYRGGNPDNARGLRLTDSGLLVMRCFVKAYDIEFQSDYKPTPKHIIYLDRHCRMPWHLRGPHLILFEADLAFRAKLCGDMDLLVNNFTPS